MDVPSDITTVFVKLMVILKSLQALAKRSHRFCKYTSEWATRAASSAYSNSRISTRLVLVLARSRERLSNLPVLGVWRMIPSSSRKACARRPEKNMPNNVGARTQTCLTPLQIGKVLDMDHQTGLLPSCSHGTLKGRKAAFQAAQQFWVCYTSSPYRRLWSGLWKPHTAGVIARQFFLEAVLVKIPCLMCF